MNKLLGWFSVVVAIQMCLSEGAVSAQSTGPVTAPSIFWRDNQWQVWKDGAWVPYHQDAATAVEPAEAEPAEEMGPAAEGQPEPQLESDGTIYWMGGYAPIYLPPHRHGDRDRRHRPVHHRRPGENGNGNSGSAGSNPGGDRRGIGIGQTTIGIGQTTIGIGQPTIGIGQTTIGIGKPTIGIGQPNTGIGQTTIGIGQQGEIAPQVQRNPSPAKPAPAIAQRHESSGARRGGRD